MAREFATNMAGELTPIATTGVASRRFHLNVADDEACLRGRRPSAARLRRLDEREARRAAVGLYPAVEARTPAGVAGAAVAAHLNKSQKCVLVAVDAHFDQRLGLAGRVPFAPKRAARARPIMEDAGRERCSQCSLVHVSDHQ